MIFDAPIANHGAPLTSLICGCSIEKMSKSLVQLRRISIPVPRALWIGIATLLLLLVTCGINVGVPFYRQLTVGLAVQRLGGRIETRSGGPNWVRRIVGSEATAWFGEVAEVDLGHTATTDIDLRNLVALRGLANLQTLNLSGTSVTDDGIAHLTRLGKLRTLYLNGTRISDGCVPSLIQMASLRELSFDHTGITDLGVTGVSEMTRIERLYLKDTEVTNAGLEQIQRLSGLIWLQLSRTRISDDGLVHLKALKKLRELDVGETVVTQAGLAELKLALPKVRFR